MHFYIIVLFALTAILQLIILQLYIFQFADSYFHLAIELPCFSTLSLHTFSFS